MPSLVSGLLWMVWLRSSLVSVSFHATFENNGPSLKVGGIVRPSSEALAFNAEPASQWEKSLRGRVYQFPLKQ